ncbi:MAG: S1 RNA-binding domain-containing protein [Lachnospiraceae bacterium]|nr:S1 RNA-binding domain-containing protein [Lachnospiraceae bacterium]MCM1239006.1 S1 RNA-binding domain-containing protein [Lachnospiraceae bacterium]
MARKKETLEPDNPIMEGNSLPEGQPAEPGFLLDAEEDTAPGNGEAGMDLNALLCSMDQEPAPGSALEESPLPELSEEDMFGAESETADTPDPMENSPSPGDGNPEASSSSGEIPAKKRASHSKKENPLSVPAEQMQDAESETAKDSLNGDDAAPASGIPLEEDNGASADGDTAESILPEDQEVPASDPGETAPGEDPTEDSAELAESPATSGTPRRTPTRRKNTEAPVLTLETHAEVETEESREDAIWHEIHNAYRTRRILTGQLGGIEQTDNGKTIIIVDYKGFRIVIPLKEMLLSTGRSPSGQEYAELMLRQNKILGNMLGAEIDFIVKGIDSKTRSVVASRREALFKKRQTFYLDTDASGMYRIYEGRIVQARVIAVAEKVIRVEVFGVECSIMARDLAWDWIGDAHERFSVGDQVLVRILSVRRDSLEEISIKADIKSVSQNTSHDNLKKCRIQSKYAGKVTDVHKGVVYIRLANGVNAVAHSCYDYRTPGKKDDVSFAVTRIDEERGIALGIITRIIRQNL